MTKGSQSKITHESHAFQILFLNVLTGVKRAGVWRLQLLARTAGVNA